MGPGSGIEPQVVNPYVGPRPFLREDAARFFGRETEARDLLSLFVSEQLVLFYAQSGAGKSSLVNTRLVPGLEERGFEVLPVGRVSGDILQHEKCKNIFVFNLLTHLDQGRTDPEHFAQLELTEFLANLSCDEQRFHYIDPASRSPSASLQPENETATILPRVLILDQFEEIVTCHPEAWDKRADFFAQVSSAMEQDPYLWVLFVMREDYVASLDPFAHLLPNQLRARFYMRRMEYKTALDAVRKPVESIRPFDTGIAELLVDNLRLVTTGSQFENEANNQLYGEYIEPVQLQVVCYQLWANLLKESGSLSPGKKITQKDIDELAKGESLAQFINKALGDFYEQALRNVIEKMAGQTNERELRNWFSTQLITEAETRGFVYQGKTHTEGLSNAVVNLLAAYYILRPDNRPGGTWFELVHDRFVSPILQSNRNWLAANQSRLLTDAKNWEAADFPLTMFYEGKQLEAAEAEILQKGNEITALEKRFVSASSQAARIQREFRVRMISAGLVSLFLILSGLTWWALSSRSLALANAQEAVQAQNTAQAIRQVAEQARDEALAAQAVISSQNATAQFQTTALVQQALNQRSSISRLQTQVAPLLEAPEIVRPSATPAAGQETPLPALTSGPLTPTPADVTQQLAERSVVIGNSVRGQELVDYQFGTGPRHIIFVGGLHAGYSPATVKIAQMMINYLHINVAQIPPAVTVDIILNANPDSMARQDLTSMVKGRLNANLVDLNTNWDCNWKQDATWSSSEIPVGGGSTPFSEPEVRAMKDYILNNLSVVVVIWEAHERQGNSVAPGGCGSISVLSQPFSDNFASEVGFTPVTYVPYKQTGAMADWLDSQSIPSFSVYLPDLSEVTKNDLNAQILGLTSIMMSYSQAAK